ncbi:hypothetical protein F5Y08DRAFT_345730 [Xylaria arbuscula]|nr:hypothetical protein F5Y08DRAFT_345730 [Xylaria arbuscula]
MDSLSRADDLPSSPWATRFPLSGTTFTWEKTNHSSLAPKHPTITNPKYYDQTPIFSRSDLPQALTDEDRLFTTERSQKNYLLGLQTWEAAALNHYARFSPDSILSGGYQPSDRNTAGLASRISQQLPSAVRPGFQITRGIQTIEDTNFATYMRERIQVNEEKWFPFLHKHRWFDWEEVRPSGVKDWSVDDPQLWDFLSLQTMLYGRIAYWSDFVDVFGLPPSPNDSVLLSYRMERKIINTHTRPEWRDQLNMLMERVIWGFREQSGAEATTHATVIVDNKMESEYKAIILMSTTTLETAINGNGTLGEVCMAQVDTALTIMHEIMHAIGIARYKDDDYEGNCLNRERSGIMAPEPFLNGTGVAETGHYMDQVYFGGTKCLAPIAREDAVPPIVFAIKEFPWLGCSGRAAPRSRHLKLDAVDTVHHVPLTWVSKMLSEHFWKDPQYPRKSDNYFHRNALYSSETPHKSPEAMASEPQSLEGLTYSYPDDALVVATWKERHRLWKQFRHGWYDRAKGEWEASPWHNIGGRRRCEEFAAAHRKRDLMECTRIANRLISGVQWQQNQSRFMNNMPSSTHKNPNWAWHAVGLLMMASLPIQTSSMMRGTRGKQYVYRTLTPSKAAASEGNIKAVTVPALIEPNDPIKSLDPNQFYEQMRKNGLKADFDQLDTLSLIDTMLELIASKRGVIHGKFMLAIMKAKEKLQAERTALRANYPGGSDTTKWASKWHFQIPPYDKNCHRWFGNRWARVPRSETLFN